uniref:Uncharacterized protein n=1 Tax=Brassica oleracea TaxID=3712 RepID=A0A3P6DVZ8_BRAOL|nr:unnamed protein product [Brassica oleracea]
MSLKAMRCRLLMLLMVWLRFSFRRRFLMRRSYSGRAMQWGISLEMLPMWDLPMLQ